MLALVIHSVITGFIVGFAAALALFAAVTPRR